MDCPRCHVEMAQLEGEDTSLARCPECAGLWLDLADLNRILLHHNMPGLESLGGRPNPDEPSGTCPDCQVDLVAVQGGERLSMQYETCEVCGGIFVESETDDVDYRGALAAITDFYKRFSPQNMKKASKRA